jgi:hypothetical protein
MQDGIYCDMGPTMMFGFRQAAYENGYRDIHKFKDVLAISLFKKHGI